MDKIIESVTKIKEAKIRDMRRARPVEVPFVIKPIPFAPDAAQPSTVSCSPMVPVVPESFTPQPIPEFKEVHPSAPAPAMTPPPSMDKYTPKEKKAY